MSFYRRRLPHWIPDGSIVFVTWRLSESMPSPGPEALTRAKIDRVRFIPRYETWDRFPSGPVWLQDPRVACVVANALRYGEAPRQLYKLYAWVIMPNHVHALWEPRTAEENILRWLKGRTGRLANRILGRTGMPFWQDESFDHWVRSREELQELTSYIESNPVKAGLVETAEQWRWSSAWQTTKTDRLPHTSARR